MNPNFKRYALVTLGRSGDTAETVKRYLPANYRVVWSGPSLDELMRTDVVVAGRDDAGWTLDGYVLPRLASGLIHGREVGLDHEIMKRVPDIPRFRPGQLVRAHAPEGDYIGYVTRLDNEETEVRVFGFDREGEVVRLWTEDLRPASEAERGSFRELYPEAS